MSWGLGNIFTIFVETETIGDYFEGEKMRKYSMAIAITVFQGLYLNLRHPRAVGGGGWVGLDQTNGGARRCTQKIKIVSFYISCIYSIGTYILEVSYVHFCKQFMFLVSCSWSCVRNHVASLFRIQVRKWELWRNFALKEWGCNIMQCRFDFLFCYEELRDEI